MNIWHSHKMTGKYPPLRVVWNILTGILLFAASCVFFWCLLLHKGLYEALNFWRDHY